MGFTRRDPHQRHHVMVKTPPGANMDVYIRTMEIHHDIHADILEKFGLRKYDRIGANYYFSDPEIAVYIKLRYS